MIPTPSLIFTLAVAAGAVLHAGAAGAREASAPAAVADGLRPFAADDVFALEYASDPRISPDGSRIVYERRMNDIMTDSTQSHLWIVDLDGSRHRPLASGDAKATSPRWSPDGGRIAWIRDGESGRDIMMLWLDTGRSGRIATVRESPRSLTWSPDGRLLAFTMPVKAEMKPLVKPRRGPEGSTWSEPVKVFDAVRYKRDGQGFVETAHSHVFVLPADGGTPRQLTSGEFDHEGPLSFSPDGRSLYFSANRSEDWEYEPVESDIFAVDVGTGALTRITDRAGGERRPRVSPDGQYIAYLYDDARKVPYRNRIVHLMKTDGSDDRALTAGLDRSARGIEWGPNGRHLYFHFDDHGVRRVARVTREGQLGVVAEGLGGGSLGRPYLSGGFTVGGGGAVAFMRGDAHRPADVAVSLPAEVAPRQAAAGGDGGAAERGEDAAVPMAEDRVVRRLTSLNEDLLANRDLAAIHEIRYRSAVDGLEIQGWYLTPPGYEPGRPYPTILEIHGGPHLAYGPQFAAELQRYAAAGYVVFYDNHRGSTGYGEDFALLLDGKYASRDDFTDHISGLDVLIERGIADPDQLYITGGSAGGIATAYAIGLTDRFRAAAVQKPVINWISKVLTADSYVYQIPYQFPAMPWEALEHYWKRSPLSLVGNVTTPTMLITGEEDQRTPISETEQFYQALKLRRVDAVMVRVPGSSHGIAGRPSRLNAKVDNVLAWFERYSGDDGDADGPAGQAGSGGD